jgi:hypothetical protein
VLPLKRGFQQMFIFFPICLTLAELSAKCYYRHPQYILCCSVIPSNILASAVGILDFFPMFLYQLGSLSILCTPCRCLQGCPLFVVPLTRGFQHMFNFPVYTLQVPIVELSFAESDLYSFFFLNNHHSI